MASSARKCPRCGWRRPRLNLPDPLVFALWFVAFNLLAGLVIAVTVVVSGGSG